MAVNSLTINEPRDAEGNARRKPRLSKVSIFFIVFVVLACLGLAAYYIFRDSGSSAGQPPRLLPGELMPPDPEYPLPASPSHQHEFKKAAVCTDAPPCSKIGMSILQKNGSAVDATIAAMFCNGIANIQSMGLGGGFLMTIYSRGDRRAYTLDAREQAPLAATEDMFMGNQTLSSKSPLAVGVPGEVRGYWAAHQRFGVLPWRELVEPSLEICRTGFNMSKPLYDAVKIIQNKDDHHLKSMFFNEKGEIKKNEILFPHKALCETLRIIAEKGGHALYNGSLADDFVQDLKDMGTIITKEDLEQYEPRWEEPVTASLPQGDTFYSVRPPGGGAIVAFIIKVLAGYKFDASSVATVNSTILTYQRITEAFKYAYGLRTKLGDAEFANVTEVLKNMTSDDYTSAIREAISDYKTSTDIATYGPEYYTKPDHGTAHISVLAQNGDAVSVTSTINFYFGVGSTTNRTGIVMNNGMDDFSSPGITNQFGVPGSPANSILPRKRPLSSMSPSVLVDAEGDVVMIIGASGGTKIITAVAQVIIRYLWLGQTIKEAVDAPRIHHQLLPMEFNYEYGNLKQVVDGMKALGHNTTRYRDRGSVICAITRNGSTIYANADYRKNGEVEGE